MDVRQTGVCVRVCTCVRVPTSFIGRPHVTWCHIKVGRAAWLSMHACACACACARVAAVRLSKQRCEEIEAEPIKTTGEGVRRRRRRRRREMEGEINKGRRTRNKVIHHKSHTSQEGRETERGRHRDTERERKRERGEPVGGRKW